MKVCLLNDSFPPVIDGVANVVLNYAQILQTQGLADVIVGTPEYPGTDYSVYPYRVIPYDSLDTTRLVKGYRAGNPLDIKEIREMSNFEPDIIHTHCPVISTYVARMIRGKTDAPIVFTYHTKFDEDIARAVKSELIQKETVKFLVNNINACDEVWVVSKGAGENLKSLGYEGEYRVVSNGVDFDKGRVDSVKVASITKDYDLPAGVPVYLFVGRIIEYKGIPVILETMARLKAAGQNFRMVFVGKGPDEDIFKEQAVKLGLMGEGADASTGLCIFTGPIYDRDVLRAWNTRADLFLFPSTYDTNGIVVREAAACGLASVLINGSCAAEGITDARNGFLTEKNADALSALLIKLGDDLNYMHEIGQNAMDEIYISWETSVRAAYDRYGYILEQKKNNLLPNRGFHLMEYLQSMSDEIARETQLYLEYQKEVCEDMVDDFEGMMNNIHREFHERMDDIKQKFD